MQDEKKTYTKTVFVKDWKQILLTIAMKWRSILLVSLLAASVYTAYKAVPLLKAQPVESVPTETASRIDDLLDTTTHMKENTAMYLAESLKMKINPYEAPVSTAQIMVSSVDDYTGVDLAAVYASAVKDNAYLRELSEKYNTKPVYLSELIRVTVYGSEVSTAEGGAVMEVKTYGTDTQMSEELLEAAIKQISLVSKKSEGTVQIVSKTTGYEVDTVLGEEQEDARDYLNDLATAYTKLDTNTDSISYSAAKGETLTAKKAVKFFVKGWISGLAVMFVWYAVKALLDDTVRTQKDLSGRFNVRLLACAPADYKRHTGLDRFLQNLAQDDGDVGKEEIPALTALYMKDTQSDHILLVGNGSKEVLEKTAEEMKKSLEDKEISYSESLDTLTARELLQKADQVLLVSERNVSSVTDIRKQLRVLEDYDKELAGVVLY